MPLTLVHSDPPLLLRPGVSKCINHFNFLTRIGYRMGCSRASDVQLLSSVSRGGGAPFSSPFSFPPNIIPLCYRLCYRGQSLRWRGMNEMTLRERSHFWCLWFFHSVILQAPKSFPSIPLKYLALIVTSEKPLKSCSTFPSCLDFSFMSLAATVDIAFQPCPNEFLVSLQIVIEKPNKNVSFHDRCESICPPFYDRYISNNTYRCIFI